MQRMAIFALLVVMVVAFVLPAIPAHAQTGSTELTITEAQINEALTEHDDNHLERLSDIMVDLQEDRVLMSATFTAMEGNPYNASLSLIPQYVNDQFVGWAVSEVVVEGETERDPMLNDLFTNRLVRAWRNFERPNIAQNVAIINIAVTDDSITYYFDEPLETRRGVDINLQAGTLSITEAELNALIPERMQDEDRRDVISDLYIDLQADQVVLTATVDALRQDDLPTVVTLVLAPSVTEDGVTWEVVSFEGYEMPAGADFSDAQAALTEAWASRWMGRVGENFQVTEITINDSELSYVLEAK